jgi:hypothetical protein
VTLCPGNCVLDAEAELPDGLHPDAAGCDKLGQLLYGTLTHVTQGVLSVPLNISGRAYTPHVMYRPVIWADRGRELDVHKCYNTTFEGIRTDSITQVLTYTPVSDTAFTLYMESEAGNGYCVEFPLPALDGGRTYTLRYTAELAQMHVYLLKYNPDTTYCATEALGRGAGEKTVTFTPEAGYLYSIAFSVSVNQVPGTYSEISLTSAQ